MTGVQTCALPILHAEWLASALVDISEAKSRELARLDDLERTYWAGWQRSQDPVEVINKRAVETHAGRRITVNTQSSDQVGDPRFLAGVGWCIEQRCKLLGIASPERLDLTTGGMPLTPKTVTMIAPVSLPQLEGGEFTYDRPDTE